MEKIPATQLASEDFTGGFDGRLGFASLVLIAKADI